MQYRESSVDRELAKWFEKDTACALLKSIELRVGIIRGVNSLLIDFKYPITAIAGKNGVGKSTILALACCAYHNNKKGYKNPKRQNTYYTFSDFFVQHKDEVSPQGIVIHYRIAHNGWRKSETFPDGVGIGLQARIKKQGGKWNDYATRVPRNVVFLGIERIVPHVERSQSRSYSKAFKEGRLKGWEDKVKDAVGYILGRDYTALRYHEYSKYSLPVVMVDGVLYSGLNMGAGENALFEIFTAIFACGRGGLLVMDEIELGLHAEAQLKFVRKLKEICLENRTQVICTTHSREIFNSLPPAARFFVEDVNGNTVVTSGISPEYAFAKLSGITGNEMHIYVEDKIAKSIIDFGLSSAVRKRIEVKIIGSASCMARQIAASYIANQSMPVLAVFDGDQRAKLADNYSVARRSLDTPGSDFEGWYNSRVSYLPGDTWPERWICEKALEHVHVLAPAFRTDTDRFVELLKEAVRSGKHNEFYTLASQIGFDEDACLNILAHAVCGQAFAEFAALENIILEVLDNL